MSKNFLDNEELSNWTVDYTAKIFEDVLKIYQRTQNDIFKMLRNSYRRFKRSNHFEELQKELSESSPEMTSRGSCIRDDCNCELYADSGNIANCGSCGHFYEEHQNLNVEDEAQPSSVKTSKITNEQRRKLQLMLGKSAVDLEGERFNSTMGNPRKEFLIDSLTAIINHPSDPLKLKKHRFKLKRYKKCFLGIDLSRKLQKRLDISKTDTLNVITEMMGQQMFSPVDKSQQYFINGKFYYFLNDAVYKEVKRRSVFVEYESSDNDSVQKSQDLEEVRRSHEKKSRSRDRKSKKSNRKLSHFKSTVDSKSLESLDKDKSNESSESSRDAAVNLFEMLAFPVRDGEAPEKEIFGKEAKSETKISMEYLKKITSLESKEKNKNMSAEQKHSRCDKKSSTRKNNVINNKTEEDKN
ncbi:hypothetical protein MHBO_002209, partial [Bonamia ostreae]